MDKILTVIIPTYNMEKLLNKCLDSLIVDNIDLLEVLVINDGSKDRSSEIARQYENKYPDTFRVIDKENGNYGSCINRGLKEATGKYIKILDADDYYDTNELCNLIKYLLLSNSDIIITPFTIRDFDNMKLSVFDVPKEYAFNNYDCNVLNFKELQLGNLCKMHAMCVRKNMLIEHGYYQTEGISYTDTQFVFYSLLYGDSLSFVDFNVYQYCIGRDEQTMSAKSMIKNNMQFYNNAYRMISEFTKIDMKDLSLAKFDNLKLCINSLLHCFIYVTFYLLYANEKQVLLLKDLMLFAKKNKVPYSIETEFSNVLLFRLWLKFKISPKLLVLLYRPKLLLSKLKR